MTRTEKLSILAVIVIWSVYGFTAGYGIAEKKEARTKLDKWNCTASLKETK